MIEAALKKRDKEWLRLFINTVENSTMPRIVWDFDYTLVYVNDPFAHSLGYKKSEMIGRNFTEFLHEKSHAKTMEFYENNTTTGVDKFRDYFNRYKHKETGDVVWIHWLKGFNDNKFKLGSCECVVVSEDKVPKEFL